MNTISSAYTTIELIAVHFRLRWQRKSLSHLFCSSFLIPSGLPFGSTNTHIEVRKSIAIRAAQLLHSIIVCPLLFVLSSLHQVFCFFFSFRIRPIATKPQTRLTRAIINFANINPKFFLKTEISQNLIFQMYSNQIPNLFFPFCLLPVIQTSIRFTTGA